MPSKRSSYEHGSNPVDQEYTPSTVDAQVTQEYQWGFVTDIEAETVPRGLNEDIVCRISAKKHEHLTAQLALEGLPVLGDAGNVSGGATVGECPLCTD